jgi:hypothetical protein
LRKRRLFAACLEALSSRVGSLRESYTIAGAHGTGNVPRCLARFDPKASLTDVAPQVERPDFKPAYRQVTNICLRI